MSSGQPGHTGDLPAAMTVSADALRRFCVAALQRTGMSEQDASLGADVLVTTDAWGVFTHGTKALRGYLRRLLGGGLHARGQPVVAAEGPAWAVIDGDSSLGMVTSAFAMAVAVGKARSAGIAYAGVRNSCHFGAAGYYAWSAARSGVIGVSVANDVPSVAAPGSRGAVTGSNPLAYGLPAGRHRPLILDISMATVAGGKVYAAKERGEPIPPIWLIGPDGRPTTDASLYPAAGTLAPAAGHKGYGIALLIEALSGALAGAALTWQVGSWTVGDPARPTNHGAAFIAIDCDAIAGGDAFTRRIDALIDEIHAAPRADGVDRLYVPGEIEWANYDRQMAEGIRLPSDVMASLNEAAHLVGLSLEKELK